MNLAELKKRREIYHEILEKIEKHKFLFIKFFSSFFEPFAYFVVKVFNLRP
jgi:hypothetical protein